ncbi:MAG TPA: TIR domain-containing protein, partial [Ktedonobacterales bacterium]
MARGDGSASATGRGRPRSAWVWLGLGWLGVLAWLAMLAVNAAPYLGGRQWPPASVLLPRLLAPPAALGLPAALAAQATPLLTALAIFLIIVVAALTISSRPRVSAAPAISTPAPQPQPPAERALEPAAEAVSDAPEPTPPAAPAEVASAPAPEPPAPTSQRAAFTPRLFISHSSADDGFGKRLAADLRAALAPADPGRVWYDSAPQRAEEVAEGEDDAEPGGLKGGMNFPREIVEQIAARNVMIVILSPEAARSRWVRYEIDQAINRYNGPERFAIYPLVYRAYPLPKAIAIFQTLDFTNTDSAAYQRQLGELVALIREGRVNLSESAPPFELGALPPPERLIGRDEELAWALTRLRARETTAVTAIGGMGGIGKSALAAVAVRQLRQERAFPDGIVAVSCENQTDPVVVLRAALTPFTAGQRTPDVDSLSALGAIATNLLEGKRALIALDNIEPDLRVEQVTTPLTDAGATLLLTARQMLPGAAVPPNGVRRLDLLSPEDALLLFARSYGRADADTLSDEQRTAATRIVALLDRHTLAVRLAGAYAAEMNRPLPRVADEIASDTLDIPEGETPRKVEAVLARSVDALPPEGQRLFAALAIFAT